MKTLPPPVHTLDNNTASNVKSPISMLRLILIPYPIKNLLVYSVIRSLVGSSLPHRLPPHIYIALPELQPRQHPLQTIGTGGGESGNRGGGGSGVLCLEMEVEGDVEVNMDIEGYAITKRCSRPSCWSP